MSTSVRWSSKTAFIFATAAAAIGLGNVWRFSYLVGENGGGAFVLTYLLCVAILGLPLLIAEIVLGRLGRKNPIDVMKDLATSSGVSSKWAGVGVLTVLASFLITTYYVVIVGWVLDYFVRAVQGHLHFASAVVAKQHFTAIQNNHWEMLLTGTAVVVGACLIIVLGIKKGLERAVMLIFPLLLLLMLCLLLFSYNTGHFDQGVKYLFQADFSKLTHHTMLLALGQAFFSLNVAMGITVMMSAYLPEGVSIMQCAVGVLVADTGFALLSGLIIFPIVFAYHLSPAAGPSLIFQTLPIAFSHMPYATVVGSLFFLMLFFAAFSSVIALLEPTVCAFIECIGWSRVKAVVVVGLACWLLSLGTIGSFSWPAAFSWHKISFFDAVDFLTAAVMLPVGGILLAIFTGWCLNKELISDELGWNMSGFWVTRWRVALRWFAPLIIFFVLLSALGVL